MSAPRLFGVVIPASDEQSCRTWRIHVWPIGEGRMLALVVVLHGRLIREG